MEPEHHTQLSPSTRYRFGEFELTVETRTLSRRGALVHVQPKPFDVLVYLLRHRGRVVSRSELLSAVWPDVVVNNEALTFALHAARKAVGDDGSRQQVIQTVPKCGFRFVAPVDVADGYGSSAAPRGFTADAQRARGGPDRPRFVGRGRIFSEVDLVLETVAKGRGRVLLFSGEAGIGKTRTVEQLADVASGRSFRVLFGRCVEAEESPVFWPWVQIVRAFASEELPVPLLRMLGEGAPEIARMVPELRELIPDLPEADGVDPRAVRFLLFDSVTRFLQRAARVQPLVLILDDLHCSDQPSLLLLQFLAREIADARILIVGAYRPAELQIDASRSEPVSAVSREEGTLTLELGGFTLPEVRELVRAVAGRIPSANAATSLHEQTGGNPLFVNQILSVLKYEDRLEEVESADRLAVTLPRRVQDVIAHQVEGLPEGCRSILRAASVIGRDFRLNELARATDCGVDEALELLCLAMASGVVVEHDSRAGVYCFPHILIREALYRELSLADRARLHARVGRALEQLWDGDSGPRSAALAHHFYQAAAVGEGERALRYGIRAGEWACERAAFEEAPPHFERALEVLRLIAPGDEARRCELLLALGDAQTKAGDRETARKTLLSAAQLAKRVGQPDKLATAALRFAPDFLAIETGVYDPALVDLLEEALAALAPSDSAVRARLLARLAVALHWADDSEERRRQLCDEALGMAERLGDLETLAYVRSAETLAHYSMEHPERYLDARPQGPLAPGDEPIALLLQLLRMTSLLLLGRISEFDAEIETFTALAEKLRQPQCLWYARLVRATRLQMQGRYEEARQWAERFLGEGQKVADQNAVHSFMVQTVIASIEVGNLEPIVPATREMVDRFPRVLGWRAGHALVCAEIGRLEDAREEIEWLRQANVLARPQRSEWFGAIGALVFSAQALSDASLASELYNLLSSHSGHLAVIGYCSFCWGSTHHWLGVLATVLEQWEEAKRHFEAALLVNSRVGARPWIARTEYDFSRMLILEGRDPIEATLHLDRCAKLAQEIGMLRLVQKVLNAEERLAASMAGVAPSEN